MVQVTTIADVCELVTDGTHYTPKNVGEGIPFLTVKDVSESELDFIGCSFISDEDYRAADAGNSAPKFGDVLFSKDGTVGKVHVVTNDRPFAVLSSLAILRPKRSVVDSQYLGHVLKSPSVLDEALKKKTGSAIRRIILSDLKNVRIPLPSLSEQRRVAAILDQADALRAKRREALVQLNALQQAIFIEMFGDTQSIHEKWKIKPLGDLLEFLTSGSRGWAEYYSDVGALFLRIQNVRQDKLDLTDVAYVSPPDSAEARRTAVQEGDVLLSITADLGRTAVIPKGLGPAHINQHLSILRTRKVLPKFLSAFISSPAGQREVMGRNKHGVKAGLNFDDIRSFRIPLPPESIQLDFVHRIERVAHQLSLLEESLMELDMLFASLQHRAFRGEL